MLSHYGRQQVLLLPAVALLVVVLISHSITHAFTPPSSIHSKSIVGNTAACPITRVVVHSRLSSRRPRGGKVNQQMTMAAFTLRAKKDGDDDEEKENDDLPLGMEEAFAKLDNLQSLDDATASGSKPKGPKKKQQDNPVTPSSVSMEKEIEVYKDLMKDSSSTDEIYSDVLSDMEDLSSTADTKSTSSSLLDDPAMQQALQDAMREVSNKNPDADTSKALDDQEIMDEIKAIMERGNAKLLASLEEIREEQVR